MATFNDVPEEILEYILCLVSSYNDLRSCRQVCRRWFTCCEGVVEKTKTRFHTALCSGTIEWSSITYPSHVITISRRYSHSACVHEAFMYVFGGCTSTSTTFNDLWRLDLGNCEWTRPLTTGTYPSPKAYASMVTWNNCLVLFGGWTRPSVYPLHQQWVLFNELHVYDILGNRWTQLYYPGSPPPTAGHSASIHENVMVVFGGLQKQEGTSLSTNDVYCLDLIGQCWFKPQTSDIKPNPRYGHSQIKVDSKHILIIAGCGGSNKLYSDVWLLELPNDIYDRNIVWQWRNIVVQDMEFMPAQLWYNPACKVGNSVVVLSSHKNSGSVSGGNMTQLLVPGSVRRQPAVWVPPPRPLVARPLEARPPERPPLDNNVNGQRGFLRPAGAHIAPEHGESSSDEDARPQPGPSGRVGPAPLGRPRPSIRPNASSDRERRLQMLSRMEERLQALVRPQQQEKGDDPINHPPHVVTKPPNFKNPVVPHILNISNVLKNGTVRWCPVNEDSCASVIGTPPLASVLYSLVLGRGHLIMFGGIPHDPPASQGQEIVSNCVTFISAPSHIV